jgi:hypothetical protein
VCQCSANTGVNVAHIHTRKVHQVGERREATHFLRPWHESMAISINNVLAHSISEAGKLDLNLSLSRTDPKLSKRERSLRSVARHDSA